MGLLTRSDLEAVLGFAGEAVVAARAPERQDEHLLGWIARMIGTDFVLYAQLDPSFRRLHMTALGEVPPPPSTADLREALQGEENPGNVYARQTRQPYFRATRLVDIVDRAAWERTNLYQLIPLAAAPSVEMRMPGRGPTWWQLEALRPGREFGDRELALLDAVRPWLEFHEERRELAAHVAAIRAATLDERAESRLSVREQQVLDRVADGASNQDIADALHISPGTVRKHLENIYAKLQVTSRTSALARTGRTLAPRPADPAAREEASYPPRPGGGPAP